MKRLIAGLAMLAALAVLESATAEAPPSNPTAIGIAVPTSGQYGPLGRQIVESAQFAAKQNGLRLVIEDTEGDPQKAAAAVHALARREDVVAVVGPIGARESQAAAAAAQREGIPLFTLSSSEAVNRAGGWVFRVRPSPAEQAAAMADVAVDHLDLDTAAILYPNIPYGHEAANAFARRFIARGGRITAVANYREDTTNYEDVLDVVVARKVYLGRGRTFGRWRTDSRGFVHVAKNPRVDFDALFIPDFHHRVARILPFLPVVGIQNGDGGAGVAVQLLGLAGWQGKAMELTGGTAAGALYVDTFAGEAAGGRPEAFARAFHAATGRAPVDIEAETFDIVILLGELLASPGAENRRADLVRKLPVAKPWTGASGPLRFGPSGEPIRVMGLYRFDSDGTVSPL